MHSNQTRIAVLRDTLAVCDLKRWNVIPTTRDQTVGQHCFRVAIIAMEISVRLGMHPHDYVGVIEWALIHDAPECLTGDLPSAFKDEIGESELRRIEHHLCSWYGDGDGEVAEHEYMIVKVAEAIESSAWLSLYGAIGTRELVDDLKCKARKRCEEYDRNVPGLNKIGMEVAGEVWESKFPLKLRSGI